MKELLRRLSYLLNRRQLEQELSNEMEFHREMASAKGGTPFGNGLRLREESRDAWGWTWLDRLSQDLHYALRMLRKSPGFTLAAIFMLAVGIGVNVAIFGFFDLMVLRPLEIKDPYTLLRFHRRSPQAYAFAMPYPEFAFFREHSRTLSAAIALNPSKLVAEGEEKPVTVDFVTANLFSELGGTASLGRLLDPIRDDAANAEASVVLSYGFWQRHFGGDPQVAGKTLRLNGKLTTVVGVASREFAGLSMDNVALWSPITQQPYFATGSKLLTDMSADAVQMWGRLQPGLTPKAAEEELGVLAAELRKQHPTDIWEKEGLPSEPGGFATGLMTATRRGTGTEGNREFYPILALAGTLGLLILAVACGNLGSLLLARGVAREREISIRAAVGAGKGRLIRQLFTESLVLALIGSAAGLFLGFAVLRSLMAFTGAPEWLNPIPDWRVIAFAAGTGFVSAILFGLTPAMQIVKHRHRTSAVRHVLVGAQVAASCILLILAGLLGRALNHAMSSNPGFEYQRVMWIEPGLAKNGYSPAKAGAYLATLEARLQGLPGVESVSFALCPPLGNGSITAGIEVDGRSVNAAMNHVDPNFFHLMQIPIIRGRSLARGETHSLVVSQSLARGLWPGQDPIGKSLSLGKDFTVVGIAGNARTIKLEDSDSVEAYLPIETGDLPTMSVLVKASGPAENLVRSVAETAKSLDRNTFPDVQLMKTGFKRKLQKAESGTLTVSLLGSIAHLLACLGIAGVVAYAVSQRTKEIGIRMALGAKPAQVLGVVLRQFSTPVAVGLVVGIGAAIGLSQLIRGVLYGISSLDPVAYVATIAVFIFTVTVAAILPARKALRVDPLRALRYE